MVCQQCGRPPFGRLGNSCGHHHLPRAAISQAHQLVGLAGAFRRSELISFDVDNVTFAERVAVLATRYPPAGDELRAVEEAKQCWGW